jgi:hypothetical protein
VVAPPARPHPPQSNKEQVLRQGPMQEHGKGAEREAPPMRSKQADK